MIVLALYYLSAAILAIACMALAGGLVLAAVCAIREVSR